MFTKTLGFIKISKNLLYNTNFLKLSNSAKILLIYLISFSNSTRNTFFFIKNTDLKNYLNLSRISIWRLSKELQIFHIKIYSKNYIYYFDLTNFYNIWNEMNCLNFYNPKNIKEIQNLKNLVYSEYLQTKHWQQVRRKQLKISDYKCQLCSKENTKLHIHHKTYENIGNEKSKDLITLCEICHKKVHNLL